jgi:adenylate cyclase
VAVAIENAKLFDEVLTMKNYNESILDGLSTGVVTLNASRRVETANPAALRTLAVDGARVVGKQAEEVFAGPNEWVNRSISQVLASGRPDLAMEAELIVAEDRAVSVNFTDLPLLNPQKETIGAILMLDDITQEKRLRGALSRYMPKEIADRLVDADAVLGGQIQEVSVLFSDIRSFTTISEALGPQETVAMLNEYFTVMADIIFRQGGILDKYIGDAILALFGTPFPTGEDADHAVTVAVEMQQALVEFNQHRRLQRKDAIRVGIGVNTDAVLVGNIGCLKRMDYTVIGDGVNLASRLEGASKFYRADVLISDMTFRQLKRSYFCREVDLIRVKGKNQPVLVHEIFTPPPEAERGRLADFLGTFTEALRFYRRREFGLAQDLFGKAAAVRGEDHLCALYRERCAYFLSTPPEAAWDGVWTMKDK